MVKVTKKYMKVNAIKKTLVWGKGGNLNYFCILTHVPLALAFTKGPVVIRKQQLCWLSHNFEFFTFKHEYLDDYPWYLLYTVIFLDLTYFVVRL